MGAPIYREPLKPPRVMVRDHSDHSYADTLPLRRVVTVRAQYPDRHDIWTIETLECGHENSATTMKTAKRRRCWQCGPQQAAKGA